MKQNLAPVLIATIFFSTAQASLFRFGGVVADTADFATGGSVAEGSKIYAEKGERWVLELDINESIEPNNLGSSDGFSRYTDPISDIQLSIGGRNIFGLSQRSEFTQLFSEAQTGDRDANGVHDSFSFSAVELSVENESGLNISGDVVSLREEELFFNSDRLFAPGEIPRDQRDLSSGVDFDTAVTAPFTLSLGTEFVALETDFHLPEQVVYLNFDDEVYSLQPFLTDSDLNQQSQVAEALGDDLIFSQKALYAKPAAQVTSSEKNKITADLQDIFSEYFITFTSELPLVGAFSTIHIGGSVEDIEEKAFQGTFSTDTDVGLYESLDPPDDGSKIFGQAEHLDFYNKDMSDSAFVWSDTARAVSSFLTGGHDYIPFLTQIIGHEVGHILGLEHILEPDHPVFPFPRNEIAQLIYTHVDERNTNISDGDFPIDHPSGGTQNPHQRLGAFIGFSDINEKVDPLYLASLQNDQNSEFRLNLDSLRGIASDLVVVISSGPDLPPRVIYIDNADDGEILLNLGPGERIVGVLGASIPGGDIDRVLVGEPLTGDLASVSSLARANSSLDSANELLIYDPNSLAAEPIATISTFDVVTVSSVPVLPTGLLFSAGILSLLFSRKAKRQLQS